MKAKNPKRVLEERLGSLCQSFTNISNDLFRRSLLDYLTIGNPTGIGITRF